MYIYTYMYVYMYIHEEAHIDIHICINTCTYTEVGGRYLNILRVTYSGTINVKYTLSCTRPRTIVANGVGVPHLGAAGCRAWPKT